MSRLFDFLCARVTFSNMLALLLVGGVLLGIRWMSSPRSAPRGNWLSACCMLGFILLTLVNEGLLASGWVWGALALGALIGLVLGLRARMIQMPELVALLNGFGGAASAIVAWMEVRCQAGLPVDARIAAALGMIIGGATLSGSLVAAGKLARLMPQRPWRIPGAAVVNIVLLLLLAAGAAIMGLNKVMPVSYSATLLGLFALVAGAIVVARVGGADMPVTISLLNSLSGVAASFAGFTLGSFVLVAVGGIVGASGLMLTLIMCHAMNRNIGDILAARTTTEGGPKQEPPQQAPARPEQKRPGLQEVIAALRNASRVILAPGYGLAVAQAQAQVKALYDRLDQQGKDVSFAIHPVAGRMPGHMHVLLAEVQIPYEKFIEMEAANPMFAEADVVVAIGANDVINPAANTAEGTPIYGMPILEVAAARMLVICNLNAEPGYAGVPNPLYAREDVALLFGDARQTLGDIVAGMG